jgi:PAS domain S-box-containing protein
MDINKLEIDNFVSQTKRMYQRLADLYQSANAKPFIPDVLPQTFVELGNASQILQLATEELYQKNEELIHTRNLLELERQRYCDLLEFTSDAYLLTDTTGIIQEANCAAIELLNALPQSVVGKSMSNYMVQNRQTFYSLLTQLSNSDKVTELVLQFKKHNGELFEGTCRVQVVYNQQRKPVALRWLVHNIKKCNSTQLDLIYNDCDLSQNCPQHSYSKGEIIPLSSQEIWYVCQGLVKLTTLCETGGEVLVGLPTTGMVFGSRMTKLQVYTATAMSDVKLININLTELEANSTLNQILSSKINQRLQQTEFLLAISGHRHAQDRLYLLLQFLKQELGTPVDGGTRLNFRLTHEDLASACCTTRVTITRMIGKLQREGKISFDSKNHMILKDI